MLSPGKVIILGFDGFDPHLLEKLLRQDELPHFSKLARTGSFQPLETVMPPQSPVAWTTMATGQLPARHGIYEFITRDPGEYQPRLSIIRQGKLSYVRPYKAPTFWDQAAAKGIPATIIRWPLTFPATPLSGSLLSGLGTPDIRGTLGRYTFFTSRDLPDPERKKGAIVKVERKAGTIKTQVPGPFKLSFQGPVEVKEPLEIELGESQIRCRLGEVAFTLEEGCWSDWVHLEFKVGFLRTMGGMARFYLESVNPEFNLYLTPINFANHTKSPPLSYPPGYGKQLAAEVGPYGTLGLAEDANALNEGLISESGFLTGCGLLESERERIFLFELNRFQQGILAAVFDTSDRIKHMFWRYLDQESPLYEEPGAAAYGQIIAQSYRKMDRILGHALARADGDTLLLVCSDHGFTHYRCSVHLNTWLAQQGYMALKEGETASRDKFAGVDWSRTKAYSLGLNSIFLNLRGREKEGAVDPRGAGPIKTELGQRLKNLTYQGKHVVRTVHDPQELYGPPANGQAPDLLIGYEAGFRSSWQTALGEVPEGASIVANLGKWSGDHCCDSQIVPGIFLCNIAGLVEKPHVKDICPLILDYFS